MSENKSHMDAKIKASFDAQQRKAPVDLWDSVSGSLDLTNDEAVIRDSFKQQERQAPGQSWTVIKRQLIIDDVWSRIATHEDRRKRRGIIWWFASASSIVLILLAAIWPNVNSEPVAKQNGRLSEQTGISKQEKKQRFGKIETPGSAGTMKISTSTESGTASILTIAPNVNRTARTNAHTITGNEKPDSAPLAYSSGSEETASNQTSHRLTSVDTLQHVDFEEYTLEPSIPHSTPLPLEERKETEFRELRKEHFGKWEVGLNAALSNSWILDNTTKSGFRSNSLVKNQASLGYDLGITATYHLNLYSSFQLQYDFISVLNQRYQEYTDGRLLEFKTKASRQKINISYLYSNDNLMIGKYRPYFGGGVFCARALSVNTFINGHATDQENPISRNDFGVNLQLGLRRQIGHFYYRCGLFSDIGLVNITSDNAVIPKKFNYTNSMKTGAFVSISYLF